MIKKYLSLFLAVLLICAQCAFAEDSLPEIPAEQLDISIILSELYPAVGDSVTATVSVTNNGEEITLTNPLLAYNNGTEDTAVASDIFAEAIAGGETATATFDITVEAFPSYVIFSTDGTEKARLTLEQKDVYEFADVEVTPSAGADETKLYYTVSGKLNNIGNGDGENIVLELSDDNAVLASETVASVTAGSAFDFTLNVEILKESFAAAEKAITIKAKKADEELAGHSDKLINDTFITDIEINGGAPVSVTVNTPFTVGVEFIPATAECEYTFAIADTTIASLGDDGKTVTGIIPGTTTLTISAGIFTKTVDLTVTRAPEACEITAAYAYYTDSEGAEVIIPFNKEFKFDVYGDYRIDLPKGLTSVGIKADIPAGMNVAYKRASDDREMSVDSLDLLSTNFSGGYYIYKIFVSDPSSTAEAKTYTFMVNNTPDISEDFPDEINLFTGLSYDMKLLDYYYDVEDDEKLLKFEAKNSTTGDDLGRYYLSDEKPYWSYTTELTEGEIPVDFYFYDKLGAKTVVSSVMKIGTDSEKPYWSGDSAPHFSSITTNSVKVTWSRATDNDRISSYRVHYYDRTTNRNYETVTIAEDETASHTLKSLAKNTDYTVYIEAFDRSGNSVEGSSAKFSTKRGSSSSSGTSGSSSGSGSIKGNSSTVFVPPMAQSTVKFDDLGGYDWAQSEINNLAAKGIIKGTSENKFSPASNIRRADFVVLLVRGLGLKSDEIQSFADVPQDSYYANAVGTAKALGIITGTGNDMFNPDSNISRQDMMVMSMRALEYIGKAPGTSSDTVFADDTLIAGYASDAVYALAGAGIVKGDAVGNVNPLGLTTRAEAAVILYRILAV